MILEVNQDMCSCWIGVASSKKQDTIADSTTEAGCIGVLETAKEVVWIRSLMDGFGVIKNPSGPVSLLCDNTGAIAQAKKPRSHN